MRAALRSANLLAMLAAVSACASFMGPAPIVSRRHMSKIAMDEATRDPEPTVKYDVNAGWCEPA